MRIEWKRLQKRMAPGIFERDGWQCCYCHISGPPLTVDHIVPIAAGGTNLPSNLIAACKSCNCSKGASLEWKGRQWRSEEPLHLIHATWGTIAIPPLTSNHQRQPAPTAAPSTALEPLVKELRELRRRNESLAQQVGFWQAHYQNVVKQLALPVLDSSETPVTPHHSKWWRWQFWRTGKPR